MYGRNRGRQLCIAAILGHTDVVSCLLSSQFYCSRLPPGFSFRGAVLFTELTDSWDGSINTGSDDFNLGSISMSSEWDSFSDSKTDDVICPRLDYKHTNSRETGDEHDKISEEDIWIEKMVNEIHSTHPSLDDEPLYDTSFDDSRVDQSIEASIQNDMDDEIAMLVRCNEKPDSLLIEEGRAVAPLGEEERNDVSQLVVWINGKFEATMFLKDAVSKMFKQYAVPSRHDGVLSMDRAGIASWMTQSLYEEERVKVSQHDRRVLKTLSDFSEYGSGRIVEDNFQRLYLHCIVGDTKNMSSLSERQYLKRRKRFRDAVWRDIRAHGMLSPVEEQRLLLKEKLDATKFESNLNGSNGGSSEENESLFVDECEILDWDYTDPKDKKIGHHGHHYNRPSSHKLVEMANDKITPLRIRDGEFVFIDEESCIGCTQCANIAPSSFLMTNSGRARTFDQRVGVDVEQAVDACPVSCMHRVTFQELSDLETARDDDGTTGQQHSLNRASHIPLYVAGIDSDVNRRSSLYHTSKARCVASSDCPKKGCYNCPCYPNPGENPFFIANHKQAEHIRAQHFIKNGEAKFFRRAIDL